MQGAAREEAGEASNENDRKLLFFTFGHFQQAVRDIPPGILFLSVVGLRSMLALVMLFQDIGRQCC